MTQAQTDLLQCCQAQNTANYTRTHTQTLLSRIKPTLQPALSPELHRDTRVCANNYGLLKLPPFLLPFDKRTCDGRKPGPQSEQKKSLLLKPTGNLLKASQEALVHRRPPCLLNPPNLALPLLRLNIRRSCSFSNSSFSPTWFLRPPKFTSRFVFVCIRLMPRREWQNIGKSNQSM